MGVYRSVVCLSVTSSAQRSAVVMVVVVVVLIVSSREARGKEW